MKSDSSAHRARILTGDTPSGRLHVGHWVGSIENRVRLQDEYECYFLIANLHAFTTRADEPGEIARDTVEILKDWLAAGIDPERATIVVQSEVPAITELTWHLSMLLPFNRVMRNPTLKDELEVKGLGDKYSFGFPLYAVGQCADILVFRPALVPVGEDQLAHIEMCREVARRFNHTYCGVDPATPDAGHLAAGGVLPIPEGLVGRVGRLVGVDGVQKMSKSLGNAIYLTDTAAQIKKKMAQLYTGRVDMNSPGDTRNALFQYVRSFITDPARVAELEDRYSRGDAIGDGHIKVEVAAAIDALLAPMRERRAQYDAPGGEDALLDIIHTHAARANAVATETLGMVRDAMKLGFARGPRG
ncbi:MAG TPA: tryptophan--tRNA ligase [Polyangiaceae bacterium]|jgi:tryptophanyl-tRNA synthetase|nr:tryptophan--tRNA ligase [Polyangiaceae bacterium]